MSLRDEFNHLKDDFDHIEQEVEEFKYDDEEEKRKKIKKKIIVPLSIILVIFICLLVFCYAEDTSLSAFFRAIFTRNGCSEYGWSHIKRDY